MLESSYGQLRVLSWNINSWTDDNKEKRLQVIRGLNPDIVLLQETKLMGDKLIDVPGFVWFGNNRSFIKNRAKCGSGGVGILVKSAVATDYQVEIFDKSFEGIIILQLTHKKSEYQFAICSVYLPPEAGEYGKNSDSFFNHLLNQAYLLCDVDMFLIGGDLNARVNVNGDYIEGIDDVPARKIIDESKNKHGDSFLDYLLDSKMCIINGRINNDADDFTSISKKGKAIVDYFFCPHENLVDISDFKVQTISSLVNELNITPGKLPDHSVLSCVVKTASRINENAAIQNNKAPESQEQSYMYGFKYKRNFPNDFLGNHHINEINEAIRRIEESTKSQDNVDQLYESICQLYYDEMDSKLKKKQTVFKNKRRKGKPWWNTKLENLWSEVTAAERLFIRARGKEKHVLHKNYKDIRSHFDRRYNQLKRQFNRQERDNIASMNTEDPKEFWDKIKRMGPQKDATIPMEVPVTEHEVVTDPQAVLRRWQTDFEALYNRFIDNSNNEEFLQEVQTFREQFENAHPCTEPILDNNLSFNAPISLNEVRNAIFRAKNNKAVGIDELPNEAFKNPNSVLLWQSFFNACFNAGVTPDIWSKALIKPIPKGGMLDKRIPLNYRGISLLPTISKIYSSILNERLLSYLEQNDLITDTQNGFRKLRSCIDHLFVLTSVIRNRKANGMSTYVCFIDLSKAFDMINRDCLFMKLANAGIQGNMYWAIRSLYSNHLSSVLVNNHQTNWFTNITGVKQGDNISTTLFALYLNDLALEIINSGKGIQLEEQLNVNILLTTLH